MVTRVVSAHRILGEEIYVMKKENRIKYRAVFKYIEKQLTEIC